MKFETKYNAGQTVYVLDVFWKRVGCRRCLHQTQYQNFRVRTATVLSVDVLGVGEDPRERMRVRYKSKVRHVGNYGPHSNTGTHEDKDVFAYRPAARAEAHKRNKRKTCA